MSTNFPTSLDNTTTLPVESAATSISTNHVTNHTNARDSIIALETKVGVDGSAVTTTHDYKLSGVTGSDKAVSKTGTETLTNKTLTSPTITTPTITTPTINGNPSGTFVTAIANGGTGQTTANTSFNALVPSQTGNSGRFLTTNGTDTSWGLTATPKFGGDGSDGALTLTSGATNIDLGNAAFVVKNYTSISITGTGSLTFTNPASTGTIVILKSQGNVTLTSSTAPMIDASGLGSAGGTAVTASVNTNGNNGTASVSVLLSNPAGSGGISPATGGAGASTTNVSFSLSNFTTTRQKYSIVPIASGGGSGAVQYSSGSGSTSGTGGRGGGTLIIECAGAWNFTTASGISVAGTNGGTATESSGSAAGGGGGGAGGYFLGIYNTLTANSGTVTVSGGVGGNKGSQTFGAAGGGGGSLLSAGSAGTTSSTANAKTGGDGATGVSVIQSNVDFS